jgi:hypothetical protein
MVTLAVTGSYATVEEADNLLENNASWAVATDEIKIDKLLEARYYIDTMFSCDLSTYDTIPDQLKLANALLAAEALLTSDIFDTSASISKERVKADVVETETEYFGGSVKRPTKLNMVRGILQTICTYKGSTVFLTRA